MVLFLLLSNSHYNNLNIERMITLIKFYDVTESALANSPYEAESMYFCRDTGKIYVDSIKEGARVLMSSEITVLATENDRTSMLAPVPTKLYVIIESGSIYFYSGGWIKLGHKEQFHFPNVLVENGKLTITDNRISAGDTAVFIPDLSVIDLATGVSVVCANGSLTVSLTADYDIPGEVIVN